MNTLAKLPQAIDNGPQLYTAITTLMNSKIDASSTANYCTKAEVQKLCLDLIDHALPSLDTFNELAIALGYVAIYATTIQNQMALKASISYVDSALALKQPTITSATNLIINRLITIALEPPTGFTDLQLRANTVYVGTVFRNSFTIRSQRSVSGLLLKVSRFKHGAQLYMHHQPRYLQHLDV